MFVGITNSKAFKAGQFGIAFSETCSSCRCTRHGLHHVRFSAFLPPWEHGPGNIHASRKLDTHLGCAGSRNSTRFPPPRSRVSLWRCAFWNFVVTFRGGGELWTCGSFYKIEGHFLRKLRFGSRTCLWKCFRYETLRPVLQMFIYLCCYDF